MEEGQDPDRFLFTSWWFIELVVLVVCLGAIVGAFLVTPGDHAVSLFGVEIPEVCTFRRLTGYRCPGCGLTRSFAWFAHGHPIESFRTHWLGPPIFLLLAAQIPYRLLRLVRGPVQPAGSR